MNKVFDIGVLEFGGENEVVEEVFDFRNKVYILSRCYFIILNINFYKWNYQAFVHRTGYYLVTSSVMVVVILVNISAISMTPKWWIRAKNYTHQLVCCHSWATNMWCISITKKNKKKTCDVSIWKIFQSQLS